MRAKIIWAVLVIVVALAAWALLTPPTPPGRVGINRLVENAVTTSPAGQSDWAPSVTGADVNFGDRIATGAASRLEVGLLDRSLLTVGANARLEIDRFVYDPGRGMAGVAVSVLSGAFRFASDNPGPAGEPIAFRTPGTAIGIRGTIIEGVVGPEAVAFLAGVPGAPDLSAEADSAAVIILREGAIGIEVNGQSVVLERPVQMVALTRTRLYPPFGATAETDRRFEALLPSRTGPPVAPPVAPPPPADPVRPPPTPQPAAPDPDLRPPPTRTPPTPAAEPPATSAPPARDPPEVATTPTRQPAAPTATPSRTVPIDPRVQQTVQPPARTQQPPPPTRALSQ